MKFLKQILFTWIVLILMSSCSEGPNTGSFANFYNANKDNEDFFTFNVSPTLARLFLSKEDRETIDFLKGMKSIKLMVYKGDEQKGTYYAQSLKRSLPEARYQDMMTVNNGGDKIEFKVRERCNKIREMIVIVADEESFVALDLKGRISLEKAIDLAKKVDLNEVKSKSNNYLNIQN